MPWSGRPDRAEGAVTVVVTIRSDYYGHFAAHKELAELLAANQVLVGAMTEDELRRAIELPGPARRAEAGAGSGRGHGGRRGRRAGSPAAALDRVAGGVGAPAGADISRPAGYRQRGGVRGAVARLAESAYAELTPAQQETARRLLLRLADVEEGEAAVRRRVTLPELVGDDPDAASVVTTLTNRRLLTSHDGMVEVAHEALLREWPRLRAWLDDDVQGRRLRHHLQRAAKEWDGSGREPSELYRGPRLVAALDWSASRRDGARPACERAFLDESAAAAEREAREIRTAGSAAGAGQPAVAPAGLRPGRRADRRAAGRRRGPGAAEQCDHAGAAGRGTGRCRPGRGGEQPRPVRFSWPARPRTSTTRPTPGRACWPVWSAARRPSESCARVATDCRPSPSAPTAGSWPRPTTTARRSSGTPRTFERLDPPAGDERLQRKRRRLHSRQPHAADVGRRPQQGRGQGEIVFWDLETLRPVEHLDNGFFQFAGGIALERRRPNAGGGGSRGGGGVGPGRRRAGPALSPGPHSRGA